MTPRKKSAATQATFEAALARLEEIVESLEKGDAPLEKSLELFEEGVTLSRRCHELLETAEKRIRKLVREDEGGITLELFGAATEVDS